MNTQEKELPNTMFNDLANLACTNWRVDKMDNYNYILLLPGMDESVNERIRTLFTTKLGMLSGKVVEGEAARQLVALYSLYAFTDKLIIGSFDLPYGRKLRNMLESGIATEEELINDVILGVLNGTTL